MPANCYVSIHTKPGLMKYIRNFDSTGNKNVSFLYEFSQLRLQFFVLFHMKTVPLTSFDEQNI